MKDFGRWFTDFKPPAPAPEEEDLPAGVTERCGRYFSRCGRECDVTEFQDGFATTTDEYLYYRGGCSPYCLP